MSMIKLYSMRRVFTLLNSLRISRHSARLASLGLGIVTVDESIREIERCEDEEKSEDDKGNICQLLKPMDGVSAQRQVLRALALEV